MVDDDEALKRLFVLDAPPERDFEFELKVFARMQGRRWLRDVADWAGLGLIAAVLLWAAGPWLAEGLRAGVRALDGAAPIVLALATVAAALGLGWITPGVLKPDPSAN